MLGQASSPDPMTGLTIIRVALAITSMGVYLTTFHLIRKERIKEGYSIMWLMAATAILLFSIWPESVFEIQHRFGIAYTTIILGVSLLLLGIIVLHFATVISRLDNENKRMAQRMAVMHYRIEEIEGIHHDPDEGSDAGA